MNRSAELNSHGTYDFLHRKRLLGISCEHSQNGDWLECLWSGQSLIFVRVNVSMPLPGLKGRSFLSNDIVVSLETE